MVKNNETIYRGFLQKKLTIEVPSEKAMRLSKLAKLFEENDIIKNPKFDFVGEVIDLHKQNIISNFYLGQKVLNKANIEDTFMHVNRGPKRKHIWRLFLLLKENGKTTLLLNGSNE